MPGLPGRPGPQGPPMFAVAPPQAILARPGPVLVPTPDYRFVAMLLYRSWHSVFWCVIDMPFRSDVLNRITRELATDTVEISNLDSQVRAKLCSSCLVHLHPPPPTPWAPRVVPRAVLGRRTCRALGVRL